MSPGEGLVEGRAHVGVAVLELPVEVEPLDRRRGQVELLGRNERVDVLVEVVAEVAVTRRIGDAVGQRRGTRASAVEPRQSEDDGSSVGKRPRIERVQAVDSPAVVVLKQLRVAERRFLRGAPIHTEAIAIKRVVGGLVEQCLGAFVDAAESRAGEAVAVVIHAEGDFVHGQHNQVVVVEVLPVVVAVRRSQDRNCSELPSTD